MTEQELTIIDNLTDAYNNFLKLPKQLPSDYEEFTQAIHDCQRLVMCRSARREHPKIFRNEVTE